MKFEGMRLFHLILLPRQWSQTWLKKDKSDCLWMHFFAVEEKKIKREGKKRNTMEIDDSVRGVSKTVQTLKRLNCSQNQGFLLHFVFQFIGPCFWLVMFHPFHIWNTQCCKSLYIL